MAEVKKENWFKRTWGKVKKYFRELRSELKKVVWPTPQQVLKNTAIVACCVVAVGVFIWLFDFVAQVGIDALIGLFHYGTKLWQRLQNGMLCIPIPVMKTL